MSKLRVGVLMGGKSIEREVSFNSGRTICDHLDTSLYDVVPLFQKSSGELFILPLRFLHRGKTSDFEHRLSTQATMICWDDLKRYIDFMYIALHGRFAEDGTLQGMLELLGIPYLGSKVFSSAVGMDKITQKQFLRMHNINIPRGINLTPLQINQYSANQVLVLLEQEGIQFPYIVKPHKEGSSLGIRIVHTQEELLPALKHASLINGIPQSVLVEECIKGMEFTCITLINNRTGAPLLLPPTEIVHPDTSFFDYEQKYMPGKAIKFTPARCTKEQTDAIQQTCLRVMLALEITTISRIDGFLTHDNHIIIIDANRLAGMAPSSFLFKQASEINMSHSQLINHLIETELQQYGITSSSTHAEDTSHMTTKIKVAVMLGGASNEKEISLESGRNIVYKLSPQKYEAIPLFLNSSMELFKLNQQQLVLNSTSAIEATLDQSTKVTWSELPHLVDFVFLGLHGGAGENGCIQGALEMLNLPYNGPSVFTSALCMDKYKTNNYLRSQGFNVPASVLVDRSEWLATTDAIITKIKQAIHYPLIIKPHDDGCSVMVHKATNDQELRYALETIVASKQYALVEECIVGMELTVGVIGNDYPHSLPPSQAVAHKGILSIEEKFLPGAGENQTPAPLPEAVLSLVKKTMEDVYKAVGCKGYSRIDCFYQTPQQSPTKQERVVILEINTLPAMTPATVLFHQAAELGIQPMHLIDMIIELGFAAHHKPIPGNNITYVDEQVILKDLVRKQAII